MKDLGNIKLLMLDCDGVLTDGKITYNDRLVESKSFSARDGLGIKLLQYCNIDVAIITGRSSEVVSQRAQDLGILHVYQGIKNKLKTTEKLLSKLKVDWSETAYIGDDWNDYPVIQKVGFSACPNDAAILFKDKVDFRSKYDGGDGAVREIIEFLIESKTGLNNAIQDFLEDVKSR